jgi:hypothetical protein
MIVVVVVVVGDCRIVDVVGEVVVVVVVGEMVVDNVGEIVVVVDKVGEVVVVVGDRVVVVERVGEMVVVVDRVGEMVVVGASWIVVVSIGEIGTLRSVVVDSSGVVGTAWRTVPLLSPRSSILKARSCIFSARLSPLMAADLWASPCGAAARGTGVGRPKSSAGGATSLGAPPCNAANAVCSRTTWSTAPPGF